IFYRDGRPLLYGHEVSRQELEALFNVIRDLYPDLTVWDPSQTEESLALEYARMMGPVAFAEALAGRGGVHDSLRLEFLTDIAPKRRDAIQMLSDIVSDHWDLLVDRGVDPEGVRYLGAGNNGA